MALEILQVNHIILSSQACLNPKSIIIASSTKEISMTVNY